VVQAAPARVHDNGATSAALFIGFSLALRAPPFVYMTLSRLVTRSDLAPDFAVAQSLFCATKCCF